MNATDEIKSRLDIIEFIGNYIQLRKAGRNYKALCPFHTEKTPSFVVFPDSQRWRCFGACSEGGDIFNFVMKWEGCDFPEALRFLAERAGVELRPPTPQQTEVREAHERLRHLLSEATLFFHRQLHNAPEAAHARAYIEERGLSSTSIQRFEIGFAPPGWEVTANYLLNEGHELQDLIDAGLLVVKEDDRTYDRFRNRLMIPIRDVRGHVVGFGARALAEDDVPKYLNSPQSTLFDKSRLLFGLSEARRSIRESETAVIVEGYMDVMQAHQAGFQNVVAQMGTTLTEAQLRLLGRYAHRLILALDPDTAGQMATDRGRQVIERVSKAAAEKVSEDGIWDLDTAEREYRAKFTTEFDPRGYVRYESRLGFDIRVIVLPEDLDPDDLIREDPEAWAELVAGALPVVEYVIQTTTAEQNLDDPKVKVDVASQIVPLINDIAHPIERSHYRQRLARLLKVDERALFSEQRGTPTRQSRPSPGSQAGQPPMQTTHQGEGGSALTLTPTRSREAFCLATLLRYPRLIYRANRILSECLDPRHLRLAYGDQAESNIPIDIGSLARHVEVSDFSHPEHAMIFRAWQEALDQDELEPLDYLYHTLDLEIRQRVDEWLEQPLDALLRDVSPLTVAHPDEYFHEEAIRGLLSLRWKRLDEYVQELYFLIGDMDNGGDALTAGQYRDTIRALTEARKRIEQMRNRYSLSGKRARLSGSHKAVMLR